jgi:hypothetical protein
MQIIAALAGLLRPVLENPLVKRVRRNHALEHATIHMLNRQQYILSGIASAGGYTIYGEVPSEKVEQAAHEALKRLRSGQAQLALHPHCGTNLVTGGLLMTTIGALGFAGTKRSSLLDRFPIVLLFMMLASLYSLPLGMAVQQHITTESDPGDMQLITVRRSEMALPFRKPITVHVVLTR